MALQMTKLNIDNFSKKHALEVEVMNKLEPYLDADICSNNDDGDDQVDPLQLKALLLWISTKLPLVSFSCKIGADVEFVVKQTVKIYKRLVKKQIQYNDVNAFNKRSIITVIPPIFMLTAWSLPLTTWLYFWSPFIIVFIIIINQSY